MSVLSTVSFRSNSLYTPLEQFDNVGWLTSRVIETVEPYGLFVSESSFSATERYGNSYNITGPSAFATSRLSGRGGITLPLAILLGAFIWRRIPALSTSLPLSTVRGGFSHLAFLAVLHILTRGGLALWGRDLLIPLSSATGPSTTGLLESRRTTFTFAPQLNFSTYRDERRVSLILAFFLVGAGEESDEEDFLRAPDRDLTVVEDVVAPLFITNLGHTFTENGALYVKACGIFGFVLINNLRGRIPYADTATSSLGLTVWVATAVFASLVALRISKHGVNYLFSLFRPSGAPFPLLFLLVPIEAISYSFRLVSLAVRLFANRRAGHTLRKVLIGFSFTFLTLGDLYAAAAVLPGLVVFVLVFLERAVAGIQAYIFVTLRLLYLKDIYVAHLYLKPSFHFLSNATTRY